MKRSFLRALAAPTLATIVVTLTTLPASAQGSMTPNQPPPDGSAAGTPNQPPPSPAPVVAAPPPGASGAATPPSAGEPPVEERLDAPKARTGFQLALRTGASIPLGDAEKNTSSSDVFGVQVPLVVDIGAKIIPNLFVGGYLGLAFGGAGGRASSLCDQAQVDCAGVSFRFGVEAQYHILPDAKLNPWIGYGIGYEIAGFSGEKNGNKLTVGYGGIEFAHLMAGLDFRVTRAFVIGPFADFALGKYSVGTAEFVTGGVSRKTSGDLANTALHEWLTLGVKVTFFP